jgi:hypothetical protein
MKQPPLDPETFELATKVLVNARRQGRDPVEALYRAGVLWSPAEHRNVRTEAVADVLTRLQTLRPADFLARGRKRLEQATVQDMYDCFQEWLEEYVRVMGEP